MSTALTNLTQKLATKLDLGDGTELLDTLKQTAFRSRDSVTDAQMTALLIVANQYGLNPWTKELYAFPDKANGIVPVVGVDGWSRIINGNPQFDGMEFRQSEEMTTMPGAKVAAPEWMECVIYRKDRSRPIVIREYLDEVYRPPFEGKSKYDGGKAYTVDGPWQTHTKRFLRHKAMIQCARIAFGFVGIYDEDEAGRILESGENWASVREAPAEKAEPLALPPYDAAEFEKNLAAWQKAVGTGRIKPEGIIAKCATKHTLTEAQRAQISALGTKPEPDKAEEEATDVRPKGEAPAFTYAQVADEIARATDIDTLNEAIDLINSVADEGQQAELRTLADNRRVELV